MTTKTLNAATIILLLIVTFACKNDDQVLGDRLAGQWTLTRIRYANPNRSGVDTTVSPQAASFTFDACQFKRGESLTCTGQHQVFNKSTVPFKFDIDGVKQTAMSIRQQYAQYQPKNGDLDLNGTYVIAFGDENKQMELKGRLGTYGGTKVLDETAYFTLKRKQ